MDAADSIGFSLGADASDHYVYNGCYWKLVHRNLIKELLLNAALKTGLKEYSVKVIGQIESLLSQFRYSSAIPVVEYEKNLIKINLKNGTFVIKENEEPRLEKFSSDDFFKYQLPFNYDTEATAPKFQAFLDEVLPEKESQMILAEYIGYVLTKGLKLEKCLVLIGPGGNGKSVVFDIISALLGRDNICSFTLQNLCNESGYFRASMKDKLLNYCSELGSKDCNPDTVKQLISNEPISARLPYGEPYQIEDYCKFMFNTNSMPSDVEQTRAYYRRFIILNFGVEIPEEKQDKNLAKKIIREELSGIFNWALEGLYRIRKNERFTESPEASRMLSEMKKETDSVAMFIDDENYKPSVDTRETFAGLYDCYKAHCKEGGYRIVSKRTFSKRLRNLGFKIKPGSQNITYVHCERVIDLNDESTDEVVKQAFNL